MDAGDIGYYLFLIVVAVASSFLKKKKKMTEKKKQTPPQATPEETFWDIFETEARKEETPPVVNKPIFKRDDKVGKKNFERKERVSFEKYKSTPMSKFSPITSTIVEKEEVLSDKEESNNTTVRLNSANTAREAFIYSEIFNRKY